MNVSLEAWLVTVCGVLALFAADMVVLRHSSISTFKGSVIATSAYSLIGVGFAAVLLVFYGADSAGQYLSG